MIRLDHTPGSRIPVSYMFTQYQTLSRADLTRLSTQPDQSIRVNYGLFQGKWKCVPQQGPGCILSTCTCTYILTQLHSKDPQIMGLINNSGIRPFQINFLFPVLRPHVFPPAPAQYKSIPLQFFWLSNLWFWRPLPTKLGIKRPFPAARPHQFLGWGGTGNGKFIWSGPIQQPLPCHTYFGGVRAHPSSSSQMLREHSASPYSWSVEKDAH